MSALAFLSGLAEGAGEEASKQGEQRRLLKHSSEQALAETIHKRLETDDTLDFPTYHSLRSQEYKLRGIPQSDIAQLLQHEKSIWDVHQQQRAQSAPVADTSPNRGDTELPNPMEGITPSLPAGPNFQGGRAVTTGDLRNESAVRTQSALNDAAIQKQRGLLDLLNSQDNTGPHGVTDPNNGSVEADGTPHYKTTRGLTASGITESRATEQPKTEPGNKYGEDVLKQFPNSGADPKAWYRLNKYSDGAVRFSPAVPQVTQKLVEYAQSPTGFAYIRQDPKGNVVGDPELNVPPPSGLQSRTIEHETLTHVIDPNTNQIIWRTIPSTTTITPNLTGGPTGALPALKPITQANVATHVAPILGGGVLKTSQLGPQGDLRVQIKVPQKGSPLDITNPIDRKAYFEGIDTKMADSITIPKGLQNAFQNRIAELGIIPNEVDSADRSRSLLAITLLPHIEEVQKLISEAKDKNEYGTLKTRWNDFLTGKVGEDTSQDKIFSRIATNLAFLGTATAMVHGGLRGGSSPGMIEHWDQAIKAPDPDTALSELGVVHDWISNYRDIARNPNARTIGGGTIGPGVTGNVPNGPKKSLDDIFGH